jgi:hypothetical protein
MPGFDIGQTVAICDSTGEHIGDFRIYEVRVGAWCGSFFPEPAYERLRHLFKNQAEITTKHLSNSGSEVADKITALGLWGRIGNERHAIRDLRLYESADGIGGSFRDVV